MTDKFHNYRELWSRADGIDGSTVQIIQALMELALNEETGLVLVVCHSFDWCKRLARWVGDTVAERGIFFEFNSGKIHAALHDMDIVFTTRASGRFWGLGPTHVFLDNSTFVVRMTGREEFIFQDMLRYFEAIGVPPVSF